MSLEVCEVGWVLVSLIGIYLFFFFPAWFASASHTSCTGGVRNTVRRWPEWLFALKPQPNFVDRGSKPMSFLCHKCPRNHRESPGIQLHLKWTCFAHVSVETVFYHVLPCCTCALHGFVSTVLRKNCSQNAGNTMVSPMEIMQPFFNHTRLEIGKLMKIAHQQPKQCVPQAPLEFGSCLGPNWIWVVSKRPGTAGRLWYPQTWAAGFAIVEACCGGMWNRFLVIKIWMSESGSLR